MIGIIILNYNTWNETELCVNSIREFNTSPYMIYVVDNCSKDESIQKLEMQYKEAADVVLIRNNSNTGYSSGNNVGIRQAVKDECEYIFIVNSDVELMNDAFTIMIETLKHTPDGMMIGPSVKDNSGQESQLPRHVLTPSVFLYERHPLCLIPYFRRKADRLVHEDENPVVFDGSVAGCCFGIKTEDFKRVGYFDEGVFLYYEEDILGYKMKAIGKKAIYEKSAKVWHKANISTNKEGSAFVQFHRWTSVLYMLKKYAHINKMQQIGISLWNIVSWDILSIGSSSHRKMLREFRKKNWGIVFEKR